MNQKLTCIKNDCRRITSMEIILSVGWREPNKNRVNRTRKEMRLIAQTQFNRSVLPVCGSRGFLPAKPSSSVCQ